MTPRTRVHASLRLTVDLVILTVRDSTLQVLVIERGKAPFREGLALPGGFVREGEDLDSAARRELREETNLDATALHLEQLYTYGAPERDPRGRVVTVAYLAIAPDLPSPVAGTDARAASWQPVQRIVDGEVELAFDHASILHDGVERARGRLEYTTLARAFCGPTFTIADLRRVYEVVWGVVLDPGNFSRKVTNTEGFVEPVGRKRFLETGRPAALYRAGTAHTLHPPMLRNASGGGGANGGSGAGAAGGAFGANSAEGGR